MHFGKCWCVFCIDIINIGLKYDTYFYHILGSLLLWLNFSKCQGKTQIPPHLRASEFNSHDLCIANLLKDFRSSLNQSPSPSSSLQHHIALPCRFSTVQSVKLSLLNSTTQGTRTCAPLYMCPSQCTFGGKKVARLMVVENDHDASSGQRMDRSVQDLQHAHVPEFTKRRHRKHKTHASSMSSGWTATNH